MVGFLSSTYLNGRIGPKYMKLCRLFLVLILSIGFLLPPTFVSAQEEVGAQEVGARHDGRQLAAVGPAERAGAGAESRPLLKGQVTYLVPKGTPLKLKLSTVPMHEMKLMNRDDDGNLLPAQVNAPITAKLSEDIFVDDNKVIPEGTVFHGRVTKILPPRRVGRPGSLVIGFDRFSTPDGRVFAFRAEANNQQASTWKTKAKGTGIVAAHAAGGAVVGALIAYRLFGIQNTIALHGYNVAGGAALGALTGIGVAVMRKGQQAVLEPGDDFQMSIDTDMLIPAATQPTVKKPFPNLPGLEIQVDRCKTKKDGLGGHQFNVEMLIVNRTKRRLHSLELFIEDDNGNRFPVIGDADEESEISFSVDPLSMRRVKCVFQIEYPKLGRKIIWLDRNNRQVLFEQRVPVHK